MDAIQAIMTRRSIRSYTGEPVSDEEVEQLLRAAMAAPSAGNQQPWHFVVVRDEDTMRRITEVHPYSSMLREAEVCIAVCAEMALEKHEGYWVQDCSAATQNILLAAHALGLGAVWLGVHPREDRKNGVREILGLPDGVECLSLISVGRPAEKAGPAGRYDESRVHGETW
ncbi:MAG: nitroreductase family protein [Candidatus Brocadiia bacterium]